MNKVINASWLRSYHWCPVQVKMYLEGVPIKSEKAEKGSKKHKSIENTFTEEIEFEEIPKKELLKLLNKETIVAKPEAVTLKGNYNGYTVLGRPDLIFSENGSITLVDFKTSNKLKIYDDVRLQMSCYLYLAKKEGLQTIEGRLLISNLKKKKIKNKLLEIFNRDTGNNREKIKNMVVSFLQNEEVFPLKESLALKPKQEFMLFKNLNKIIRSIENENFSPNFERCKYCSTENCPVKNEY